ncbi:MAG: KamA family radical SAM protein [Bradymonadia bacterium]
MIQKDSLRIIEPKATEDAWVHDLRSGASKLSDLVALGHLSELEVNALSAVEERFKFRVGRYYLSLINWLDPKCPIRAQAIPSASELRVSPSELSDPTGDDTFRVTPLLIHRYPDRVLLMPTLNCPMYCRYCFRKVGLNSHQVRFNDSWEETLEYLRERPEIEEVILSGGDPLLLSDHQLRRILDALRNTTPIRRIRIHSRVPVTLPMRLTDRLISILANAAPVVLVAHFNHPKELTTVACQSLRALRRAGVTLSNQSVLLKGVNNDPGVLRDLCTGLLDQGVIPHYLHHPDVTVGTEHLRITLEEGIELYRTLRGFTSGLAIPTYVMEIPNGGGKVIVDSGSVQTLGDGQWALVSPRTQCTVVWSDPAHVKRTWESRSEKG